MPRRGAEASPADSREASAGGRSSARSFPKGGYPGWSVSVYSASGERLAGGWPAKREVNSRATPSARLKTPRGPRDVNTRRSELRAHQFPGERAGVELEAFAHGL